MAPRCIAAAVPPLVAHLQLLLLLLAPAATSHAGMCVTCMYVYLPTLCCVARGVLL